MSNDTDYDTARQRLAKTSAAPDAYREEMWQHVSRSWQQQGRHRERMRVARVWGGAGFALAATLIVGIWVGRTTGPEIPQDALAATPVFGGCLPTPYRVALNEHLRSAETLLVLFGAAPESDDAELARSARELALTTRLLIDSRAGDDDEVRRMLLDLELTLVQISRLVDERDATERQVVRDGLADSGVLPRLQQLVPERATNLGI